MWDTGYASTGTRWNAQPSWGSGRAYSFETCDVDAGDPHQCANGDGSGWAKADITTLARSWVGNGAEINAVGLKADNESDSNSWKRFGSSEGDHPPFISVTYNSVPPTPAGVEVQPSQPGSATCTNSATPRFLVRADDADGGMVGPSPDAAAGPRPGCWRVFPAAVRPGCGALLPDRTGALRVPLRGAIRTHAVARRLPAPGPETGHHDRTPPGPALPSPEEISSFPVCGAGVAAPAAGRARCRYSTAASGYPFASRASAASAHASASRSPCRPRSSTMGAWPLSGGVLLRHRLCRRRGVSKRLAYSGRDGSRGVLGLDGRGLRRG
ncbi:DNRLRE domain-containing protein [Kitasatospora sp. NPDC004240]